MSLTHDIYQPQADQLKDTFEMTSNKEGDMLTVRFFLNEPNGKP